MNKPQTIKRMTGAPAGMPNGERFLRAAVLMTENVTQTNKIKRTPSKETWVVVFMVAEPCLSFQPFQTGVLELVVTGQRESAADAIGSDKSLEQRSRELNILAVRATSDDVTGSSPIIFQILIGREAEMELVSIHGTISPLASLKVKKFTLLR